MVNSALSDEFSGGLHALSVIAKTPEEIPAPSNLDQSVKSATDSNNSSSVDPTNT